MSEDHGSVALTTNVADVDSPLLSVAQIVHNGGKVVFLQTDCHIEYKKGSRDRLEQRDGLHVLKLWIPRDQGKPFTGQA